MAVTHEHLRIVPAELGGTNQRDQSGVEALPDRSYELGHTDRSTSYALLRSLLAIQGEGTLHGRLERLVEATVELLERADAAVAVLDDMGDTFEIATAGGRLSAVPGQHVTVLDDLIGAVARYGESRVIGDVSLDPPNESDRSTSV